jgi:hypothetical protein
MEVKKAEAQSSFHKLRLELDCRTEPTEYPGSFRNRAVEHGISQEKNPSSHRSTSEANCTGLTAAHMDGASCDPGLRVSKMFSAFRDGVLETNTPPTGPFSTSLAPMIPPPSGASSMPCRNMWPNADMVALLNKKKGGPSASLASKAAGAIGAFSL